MKLSQQWKRCLKYNRQPTMLRLLALLSLAFAPASSPTIAVTEKTPLVLDGVQQLVAYHEHIISGAKPSTPAGFKSLYELGVRTIICVDGVAPNCDAAAKLEIQTIHIPLKYGKPTPAQILDIVTAVSRKYKQHTVFIHCHKGKHRSAIAASIACIALGECNVETAKARMLVSQTSPAYTELWKAVEQQKVIPLELLSQNKSVFPSVVSADDIVDQMIDLENALDVFELIQVNHWRTNDSGITFAGAEVAGMMADTFRTMQTNPETEQYAPLFQEQVLAAINHASSLEEAILQSAKPMKLDKLLSAVEQSCITCHEAFRE